MSAAVVIDERTGDRVAVAMGATAVTVPTPCGLAQPRTHREPTPWPTRTTLEPMRMRSRFVTAPLGGGLALAVAFWTVCGPEGAVVGRAQVRRVYSRGTAGLVQQLRRLQTTASAMHTAAHPDDEDTALIAKLARGDHARTAYLSLTRGDGGQNIIGPELFEALGVIRTEELLQARTLDGGEQLFTRAVDFGYSKTREEAAEKWGEEAILGTWCGRSVFSVRLSSSRASAARRPTATASTRWRGI